MVAKGEPHPGYTDQADHVFSYALYPHPGDCIAGSVIQAGYEFNYPLRQVLMNSHGGERPGETSYMTIESPNVIVEAVKKAEDGDAVVIRLYESQNASARAVINFGFPIQSAEEANLMEEPIQPLEISGNSVMLVFKPFEIKTLMVK